MPAARLRLSIFAETSYPLLAAAVTCPTNSNGTSVVSGCSPDAGYYGTVIATTIHPHYATDGANGVSVASCTSQDAASCTTDATATCTTKAGQTTTMACDDPAEGFWVDQGFATVSQAGFQPRDTGRAIIFSNSPPASVTQSTYLILDLVLTSPPPGPRPPRPPSSRPAQRRTPPRAAPTASRAP